MHRSSTQARPIPRSSMRANPIHPSSIRHSRIMLSIQTDQLRPLRRLDPTSLSSRGLLKIHRSSRDLLRVLRSRDRPRGHNLSSDRYRAAKHPSSSKDRHKAVSCSRDLPREHSRDISSGQCKVTGPSKDPKVTDPMVTDLSRDPKVIGPSRDLPRGHSRDISRDLPKVIGLSRDHIKVIGLSRGQHKVTDHSRGQHKVIDLSRDRQRGNSSLKETGIKIATKTAIK